MFWALLVFTPLTIYLFRYAGSMFIWVCSTIAVLLMMVPGRVYKFFQLSSDPRYYERLGVLVINNITQHGQWVNGLIRKIQPGTRMHHLRSAKTIRANMEMFEKFHYGCLFMFTSCMVHAVLNSAWGWSLFFVVSNLLFNIYPILIQQYLRIRLAKRK
ncbi:MAG: hypothetical protein WBP58_17620 [Chitinophagaceae bacterium]